MIFNSNKPEDLSDDALVKRFQKENDLQLLALLFNRYTHLVYGVSLKYLKNREDSQDAVIQIFELLVSELPKHEIHVFKNWLHSVTRNYCLMQLRKEKSKRSNFEKYAADFFMENEPILHPLDSEDNLSVEDALQQCLEKLKREQQHCISLFYFEEKCYREIAEQLQLEEKKVKSYLQNAKRNLKNCLESKQ